MFRFGQLFKHPGRPLSGWHRARIAAAFLGATVILVAVVLPAEYGVDPLGMGQRLGLVVLGPYEALEYKYRIEQGGALLYSWRAEGELIYDFHAEPDGAPRGHAESFDKGRASEADGAYNAPFAGIHGWYWENPGRTTITLNLFTSGFYSKAIECRDGDEGEHPLDAVE